MHENISDLAQENGTKSGIYLGTHIKTYIWHECVLPWPKTLRKKENTGAKESHSREIKVK